MKRIHITTGEEIRAAAQELTETDHGGESDTAVTQAAAAIVAGVREGGDAAVAKYTAEFDGVELTPSEFEISQAEIDAAFDEVDSKLVDALCRAHDNIYRFHEKNLRPSWEEEDNGAVLGQRLTPISSVGLYVPGGKAFYPSTMLMNIIPARVAGVSEIVVVSPPSYNGTIHPLMRAAAKIAGATRVFRVGGAQSIAALAYGTEIIPNVLKIAGPGNAFVTAAKRIVSGHCDIDKEAGPSEVLVVSDGSADARLAAIELLAQAEHDEEARAMLIATSDAVADAIETAAMEEMTSLSRIPIIRTALLQNGRIYVVPDLEIAARLADAIAPEHMAIQTEDPRAFFDKVNNVGCCVLGADTAVAVGDYYAGPNHTLPTGRRARFSSPLTADDFRKVTSIIEYTPDRTRSDAEDIMLLAEAEALTAHARAIEIRK